MSQTSSEDHTLLPDGPVHTEMERLQAERDMLRARLVSLEARRAELVGAVLELAATRPRGAALLARLESLVDQLVSFDLRCAQPQMASKAHDPSATGHVAIDAALDAIVVADGSLLDLRRCLQTLASRTPNLQTMQVVTDADGPSSAELEALEGRDACDFTLVQHGMAGLAAALQLGDAPLVAVLGARAVVTQGWSRRLASTVARDERIGVIAPMTDLHGSAGSIPLPPRPRLGPDGIALLIADAGLEVRQTAPSPQTPCCVLRRKAYESISVPPSAGKTLEQALAMLSERLAAAGWSVALGADTFVHVEAPASPWPRAHRRRASDAKSSNDRTPTTVLTASATDLVRECSEVPSIIGEVTSSVEPLARLTYVADASEPSRVAIAALEVAAIRQCGVRAELLLIGEPPRAPWPEARYSTTESLELTLLDADIVVATGNALTLVRSYLSKHPRQICAYLLTEYDNSAPGGVPLLATSSAIWHRLDHERSRAIALPPLFNDRIFHPHPDEGGSTTPFTLLARLRPGCAPKTLQALEGIRERLPDAMQILTLGPAPDLLISRGCPAGAWQAAHQVPTSAAELSRLLNSVDIYMDVALDLDGRNLLEAMACGVVSVVSDIGAAVELAAGGRAAMQVSLDAPSEWVTAVTGLASDWSLFQDTRRNALATSAQHGLTGGGASRLAALRELVARAQT